MLAFMVIEDFLTVMSSAVGRLRFDRENIISSIVLCQAVDLLTCAPAPGSYSLFMKVDTGCLASLPVLTTRDAEQKVDLAAEAVTAVLLGVQGAAVMPSVIDRSAADIE